MPDYLVLCYDVLNKHVLTWPINNEQDAHQYAIKVVNDVESNVDSAIVVKVLKDHCK